MGLRRAHHRWIGAVMLAVASACGSSGSPNTNANSAISESTETHVSISPAPAVTSTTTATISPSSVTRGSGYNDYETPRCLLEQGLRPTDPQPYPREVAVSAFEACRDLMTNGMVAGGMPADKVAEQMAFWECMAEQGWIWFQPAAYDAATTCGPRSTGG